MSLYLLIPVFLIGALIVFFGLLVFLGRFRNGRYLRPIITTLSKIPWLKRQFQKVSQAAIERQNPELASAMRKIQRVGPNPDEKRMTAAYHSLSPSERQAYQEFADAQGATPEGANREQRRRLARAQQANRPRQSAGPSSGSGSAPKRKRK